MSFPELLLIFTASALASVHCAAMCGGFTLSLVAPSPAGQFRQGTRQRLGGGVARLSLYHAGKLFTYVFIGALAGLAGAALLSNPALRAAQVAFSALAGALIVVVGLQTLGLVPGGNVVNRLAARLWLGPFLGPFFKAFREWPGLEAAFFLGVFNGFLPCGLVYSFALAAAGTGSPGAAMLSMLAFGLGTVPMLGAVAVGGTAVGAWLGRPGGGIGLAAGERSGRAALLTRGAGMLVVLLGALTVLRGTPLYTTLAASVGLSHSHHESSLGGAMPSEMVIELEPAPAPHFTLTAQDGHRVSLHDYHGRVVVMDFIYTTCTTSCPLLTATFRAVQDGLGSDLGEKVALVSVSVDPATDTPEVLRAFGEEWGADFLGWSFLTGNTEEVQAITADYAVYVERLDDGLAHTETFVVIDKHGQLRSVFGLTADPATILDRVHRLAAEA